MSIQHSGDTFIYTEPGIRVDHNQSSVRVSIDRRGYSRRIEDYGGGDIYDNITVRRGNRRLMVESSQHSFRVKESLFDDHEHLIAELTRYNDGVEGYVLTNPYYRTSSYSTRPELRGESRYYDNYEQWLDEALLAMEKVAALEIPEAPLRATVRYSDLFDPVVDPYEGPIREPVATPAARPRRYRASFDPASLAAACVEDPIDLPHPIAVDPIIDCPPPDFRWESAPLTADVTMRSQLTYENLNQTYEQLRTYVN